MRTSKIKIKNILLYCAILIYATSCDLDSLSEMEPEQAEKETLDDSTGANLRKGNVIFEEMFGGNQAFSGQSLQFAGNHSFQVVNDPLNSHNKVGKFELRYGDKIVKGSKRAEVGFRKTVQEGWYSYSVFFPTTDYKKDGYPEIISQWHQTGGGSPPNAVQIENDEIYLRSINRSDTRDNSNKVYTNYSLGKVERGKWHEFVFHIVHSPNTDGLIEIWLNKDKIHTITGPNMRKGYPIPNLKVGIYKWTWASRKTNTDRRVVYFDNVKVGDEQASLEDFVSDIVSSEDQDSKEKAHGKHGGNDNQETEIITGFNLIQANTDRDLGTISNGEKIHTNTHKMNIRANTSSTFNGEVRFKLSGTGNHTYIDGNAPFALFGDNGKGDYYFGSGLNPGNYTLEAIPYENGKAGKKRQISFTVTNNNNTPEIITGFNLIQANTDRDLGTISNGETIYTNTHKMNIRANTSSSFKGEVRFKLSGTGNHSYIDGSAPFALFGDNGKGDYYFGSGLRPGNYTLEAIPYENGKAGKKRQIKFTIINKK